MTYRILDNPRYQNKFQYIPNLTSILAEENMGSIQMKQSDYVKEVLSTFYLQE
jgi:hypothetical protein